MPRKLDAGREGLVCGSALRHVLPALESRAVRYDPSRAVGLDGVFVGEVVEVPVPAFDPVGFVGMQSVRSTEDGWLFGADPCRPALVAMAVGIRFAPRSVSGGLRDPFTGRRLGEIRGGTVVDDLIGMNVAGFALHRSDGHAHPRIRVLGAVLDRDGRPLSLRRPPPPPGRAAARPATLLVTGAGMETGKTTCCMAVARACERAGLAWAYEKLTGTASMRDPMRVETGDYDVLSRPGARLRVCRASLRAQDFVDAPGTAGDLCLPPRAFTRATAAAMRERRRRPADVRIVEMADHFLHRSNRALLADRWIRGAFDALIYVPDPSLDAMAFARDGLRASPVRARPLGFAGPVATDARWSGLRAEAAERLGVPVFGGPDPGMRILEWLLAAGRERP